MDISSVLEKAPGAIASYTVKENECYAEMLKLHEEYKRLWAKMYLEKKATEEKVTIKEIECMLEMDKELTALKDRELMAEIEYRSWRQKKDNAKDHFVAAQEIARTRRTELKSLHDTV